MNRTCQYDALDTPQASVTPPPSEEALSSGPGKDTDVANSGTFPWGGDLDDGIDNVITANLSRLVGDVPQLREAALRYFSTIHLWFPILSESAYYESLPGTFVNPQAESSLLSLSMMLVVTHVSDSKMMELYTVTKTCIALTEAAGTHSLRIVQARLLITLFEVGNALEEAAYISIASTARAAACISLNDASRGSDHDSTVIERVWWGVVLLDR